MNCSLASLYTGLIANSTIFSAANSCGQPPASWGCKHCICLEFWKRNSSSPTILPIATPSVPVPDARTRCLGIVFWCDFTDRKCRTSLVDLCRHHTGLNNNMGLFCCVQFFPWDYCHMWVDAESALILSLCFKIIGSVEIQKVWL